MAKSTFLDFSTTAGDNTDCGGIGILGTNSVSNFDNAFRTLMAILRRDIDNGTVFATKSGAYTAVANDNNAFYEFTAAATLTLTAAATLGADWHMVVFANGGDVTIDADGTELINGAETLVVADGDAAYLICTGSGFKAVTIPSAASVATRVDTAAAQSFTAAQQAQGRSNIGATGNLFKETVFTSSGTFTFQDETLFFEVEVLGGGGAGGGANAVSATNVSAGGGGAAGAYSRAFRAKPAATTATITVGAAGAPALGADGGNGGTSSYDDGTNTLTAQGGRGGKYSGSQQPGIAGVAGDTTSATGGDINSGGGGGTNSIALNPTATGGSNALLMAGTGGTSVFSPGGNGAVLVASTSSKSNGSSVSGYGCGGGGAVSYGSAGTASGGSGGPGLVIIREYR